MRRNHKMNTTEDIPEDNQQNIEKEVDPSTTMTDTSERVHINRLKNRDEVSRSFQMDKKLSRFPHSVVWTPIPLLTWLFPFVGHMGICYTNGVIRDFAGPYTVTEDNMAFGKPTKYWILNIDRVMKNVEDWGQYKDMDKAEIWDRSVYKASEVYKERMHNLFCDNCHSHTAMALNKMKYGGSSSWNMFWLALYMLIYGKYVSLGGFVKSWLPFGIILILIICLSVFL